MNRIEPCQECNRSIVRVPHVRTGTKAPIEFMPSDRGNIIPLDSRGEWTLVEAAVSYRIRKKGETWDPAKDGPLYISHFSSCSGASHFRRKGRAA